VFRLRSCVSLESACHLDHAEYQSVTAVSVARIAGVVKLFYFPNSMKDPFHDITMTLSIVEPNLAIATACIPALRPMFKTYFPSVFGSSNKVSGYMSSHHRINSHSQISSFPGNKSQTHSHSHSRSHSRKPSIIRDRIGAVATIAMEDLRMNKRWTNSQSHFRTSSESEEKVLPSQDSETSIKVTTDVSIQSRTSTSKLPTQFRSTSRGASRGSENTIDEESEKSSITK
jgi:hypothetical protein